MVVRELFCEFSVSLAGESSRRVVMRLMFSRLCEKKEALQ